MPGQGRDPPRTWPGPARRACARRIAGTGVPAITGVIWYSAPSMPISSTPMVPRCVNAMSCAFHGLVNGAAPKITRIEPAATILRGTARKKLAGMERCGACSRLRPAVCMLVRCSYGQQRTLVRFFVYPPAKFTFLEQGKQGIRRMLLFAEVHDVGLIAVEPGCGKQYMVHGFGGFEIPQVRDVRRILVQNFYFPGRVRCDLRADPITAAHKFPEEFVRTGSGKQLQHTIARQLPSGLKGGLKEFIAAIPGCTGVQECDRFAGCFCDCRLFCSGNDGFRANNAQMFTSFFRRSGQHPARTFSAIG